MTHLCVANPSISLIGPGGDLQSRVRPRRVKSYQNCLTLNSHCTLLAIISSQNQTPYYNGTHSILHFARESIYQWICGSFKGFGKDMWIWYIIWHYIYTENHTRGEFAWQTRLWHCWSSDTAPSEMKLTFEKALPIALVMESASNIAQLHSSHGTPSTQSDVNKLSLASGKHSYHKQPQKHKHVYVCVLVTQVIFDALHICIGKIGDPSIWGVPIFFFFCVCVCVCVGGGGGGGGGYSPCDFIIFLCYHCASEGFMERPSTHDCIVQIPGIWCDVRDIFLFMANCCLFIGKGPTVLL